jgi:hypothetical protein
MLPAIIVRFISTNFQDRFTRTGPIDGDRLRQAGSPELMHRSISAKTVLGFEARTRNENPKGDPK